MDPLAFSSRSRRQTPGLCPYWSFSGASMGAYVRCEYEAQSLFLQRYEDHNEALDSTLCPAKRRRGHAEVR